MSTQYPVIRPGLTDGFSDGLTYIDGLTYEDYIPAWVDPDRFISPDPPPLPDGMQQEPSFTDIMHTIRQHFRGQPDTLVSGKSFVYYDRGNLNNRYVIDCYIAFGVDVSRQWARNAYSVWLAGKAPDFALEIASRSTWHTDMVIKRRDYAVIGISEYWRFDSTGGDYYDAPLAGDRLVDGCYEPMALTTEPDGMVWGYSSALDLCLCYDNGKLRFYDYKTASYLLNLGASEDALKMERAAYQAAVVARQAAEYALKMERAAHQAAVVARQAAEDALETEQVARRAAEDARQAARGTLRRLRERPGESEPI